MFYFKIFKVYLEYLVNENLLDRDKFLQDNSKKKYLHLFRSNYFIVLSIKYFFFFLNTISILVKFKKISNLEKNLSIKIIKIVSKLFSFYTNKLNELIFAVLYIQLNEFNEKTDFLNVSSPNLNNQEIFDAIVIGSGPSGSISANYLKKNFKKVLILEKGNAFSHYLTKHPGDEFLYKWNNCGVNTTLLKNQISFSSGSCFGGGSEVNSGLLHYPDKDFIEKWKNDFNVSDFNFLDLKKDLDNLLNTNNLISLTTNTKDNFAKNKFFDGIISKKLKYEELFKFENIEDKILEKKTMSKTLLSKFINNGGKIFLKYTVDKFYRSKDSWIIEGIKNKKRILFKCKNLFLCAGSIYTNQLLIKNKMYQKLNKPDFFKFHPMIKVIAEYSDVIQNGKENVHNLQITDNYPDFLIGQAASGYRFLKFAAYGNKNLSNSIDKNWKKMSVYHSTFSLGKGKIYNSFLNDEFIYSYDISNKYLELFKKALSVMINTLYASGAKNVYFIGKNISLVESNKLENFLNNIKHVKEFKYSSVHILGGVKMGEEKNCLVDSYGKIKNYDNIYVNDSSLINHSLLKNPQGTIMSIANRNIMHFLKNA
jgi:hypothetical protein